MTVHETQERTAITPTSGGVYLVGENTAAVLPLTDAAAMVGISTMIENRGSGAAARVAELVAFAARLRDLLAVDRPVARLDVSAREQEIVTFLIGQSRARTDLRARIRNECRTCGYQTLVNPDEEKLKKRERTIGTLARGVGVALFSGGVAPVMMASSLVGFMKLTPDFDCPKCHGLDAEESIVVFCPDCKALHDEVVLKSCRCGHDFLAGVDTDIWQPTDRVPFLAGTKALRRLSFVSAGDVVRAVAAAGERRFVTLTGESPAALTLWDAGEAGSEAPPRRIGGAACEVFEPALAVTGDGAHAAVFGPGGATVVRTVDGAPVTRHDGLYATSLAFNPDGSVLALASAKGVELWDSDGRRWSSPRLDRWGTPPYTMMFVAFQPGGTLVALARGRVVSVRRADGTEVGSLKLDSGCVCGVDWTADGSGLRVRLIDTGMEWVTRIVTYGASDLHQRAVLDLHFAARDVVTSPDDRLIAAVSGDDGTLRVLDADTGHEIAHEILPPTTELLAFLGDERLVLAHDDTVEVWAVGNDRGDR